MAVHRAYNQSFVEDGVFYKCSQEERLADEIAYYDQLPAGLSHLFPNRYQSTSPSTHYILALEQICSHNLGQQFLEEGWGVDWQQRCGEIKENLRILHGYQVLQPEGYAKIRTPEQSYEYQMYAEKTVREFNKLLDSRKLFDEFEMKDEIVINGKTLLTFQETWKRLQATSIYTRLVHPYQNSIWPTIIHGDCCLSNILVDYKTKALKFVDPRGSFGRRGIWGDPRYDFAKLKHSIDGLYEAMIYDKFQVNTTANSINFQFDISSHTLRCRQEAYEVFESFKDRTIAFIEGTIFIGMCARHNDSFSRQLVMYATGLQILNELL